ncbi:hypothetical protein HPB50_004917 [Hyalomma asiaticum]|uniref:Uncharacterized protein n=1 Tax=Hyalomma asiaticum TaxID=266040 RepID=A0ACB7S0C8_HYAAI|nr:hypothetical protein HPB50_004917 [Hyalomma asiaticum]
MVVGEEGDDDFSAPHQAWRYPFSTGKGCMGRNTGQHGSDISASEKDVETEKINSALANPLEAKQWILTRWEGQRFELDWKKTEGKNTSLPSFVELSRRRTDDVSWPSFVVARRSLLCFVLPAFSCSLAPRLGNPLFSERGCPVLGVSSVLLEVARVHGALRCGP